VLIEAVMMLMMMKGKKSRIWWKSHGSNILGMVCDNLELRMPVDSMTRCCGPWRRCLPQAAAASLQALAGTRAIPKCYQDTARSLAERCGNAVPHTATRIPKLEQTAATPGIRPAVGLEEAAPVLLLTRAHGDPTR